MEYKLFTEFITLQALLKECGIIQSGGAIKAFLVNYPVLYNGETENRRGKKIRIGDVITLPNQTITIVAPTQDEVEQYMADKAEKERIATLVKTLNKANKKEQQKSKSSVGVYRKTRKQKSSNKKAVRFPGT